LGPEVPSFLPPDVEGLRLAAKEKKKIEKGVLRDNPIWEIKTKTDQWRRAIGWRPKLVGVGGGPIFLY